eukprot:symbB.v1.2.036156.t1/scaffold4829.1/size34214/1
MATRSKSATFVRGRAARKRRILRATKLARRSKCIQVKGNTSSSSTSSDEEVIPEAIPHVQQVLGMSEDFLLPCGLYQAQVMDLMHRTLTPED